MIRIFVAHSKTDSDPYLSEVRAGILQALAQHGSVDVVLGRDDHERHFARCGGWDEWCVDVACGVDPVTREPRYSCFVALERRIGRVTASILALALQERKLVLLWEEGRFLIVHGVVALNPRDLKFGWEVRP